MVVLIELRTYRLRPGTKRHVVELLQQRLVPLLAELDIEVVASGGSMAEAGEDDETAYLACAAADVAALTAQRQRLEAADDWHGGLRAELAECVDDVMTVVLPRSALIGLGLRP